MRWLFKISLTLSILITAILAIIPLTTGIWLKHHYQEVLNRLNQSSNLSIQVVRFQRIAPRVIEWLNGAAHRTWHRCSRLRRKPHP